MFQGTADQVVPAPVTDDFARRLCGLGNRVLYRTCPDADHVGVLPHAEPDFLGWMRDRLEGRLVPSTC